MSSAESAASFNRQLAALADRLAANDIVVRSLRADWGHFGSWLLEVTNGDDERRRVVTLLNPLAERLTGWTQQGAAGRPVDEVIRLVHQESRKPMTAPVIRRASSREMASPRPVPPVVRARAGSARQKRLNTSADSPGRRPTP